MEKNREKELQNFVNSISNKIYQAIKLVVQKQNTKNTTNTFYTINFKMFLIMTRTLNRLQKKSS